MTENKINKRLEELTLPEYTDIICEYVPDFSEFITEDLIKDIKSNKKYQKYFVKTTFGIIRSEAIKIKTAIRKEALKKELEKSAVNRVFLGSVDHKKYGKPVGSIISSTSLFLNKADLTLETVSHKFTGEDPVPLLIPNTEYTIKKQPIELKSGTVIHNLIEADGGKPVKLDDLLSFLNEMADNDLAGKEKYSWCAFTGRLREFEGLPVWKEGEIIERQPIAQNRYAGAVASGGIPTFIVTVRTEHESGKNSISRLYFRKQKYGMSNLSFGEDFLAVIQNAMGEGDKSFEMLKNIYNNRPVLCIGQLYKNKTPEGENEWVYPEFTGIAIFLLDDDKDSWADHYGKKLAEDKMKTDVYEAIKRLEDMELNDYEECYAAIASEVTSYDKDKVLKHIEAFFDEE